MPMSYDAILVVSFGGPEGRDDVIPFLENVLRGRDVPRARLEAVAEHYYAFGGVSPINAQVRGLIRALEAELAARGPALPVYWGNRNWHPLLPDTLGRMRDDGVRRALAFVTSPYSSYSGCRQYREDIARAAATVGTDAPAVDKLRVFFNHPGFVEPLVDLLRAALSELPSASRGTAQVAFTAHSLPLAMARTCAYTAQLGETCRLVAAGAGIGTDRWRLVYQSRSGRPSQPWLEPDIEDHLRELADAGVADVVVMPIGFISDHMEVLHDLDVQAQATAAALGVRMVRAGTVGTDPRFIAMIRELVLERLSTRPERRHLGGLGPGHDVCPPDCCPYPGRADAASA